MWLRLFLTLFIFSLASTLIADSSTPNVTSSSHNLKKDSWTQREAELLQISKNCANENLGLKNELAKKTSELATTKRERFGFWDSREVGFFGAGVLSYAVAGLPGVGVTFITLSVADFLSSLSLWNVGPW